MPVSLRRRHLAFAAFAAAWPGGRALAEEPRVWLADMHSHAAMYRQSAIGDLRQEMADSGTALVGWALVDDTPFTQSTSRGIEQVKQPQPGEPWDYFQRRVQRYDAALRRCQLPKALTPADVDAALRGEPHVVMASESANFLEGQAARLAQAHAMGLRHLQLVHFMDSPLGDRQTAAPTHGGMAPAGLEVVRESARLGILVDLAHCAPAFVDAALDGSDAAMVWSHSWVRDSAATWREWQHVARALSLAQARRIAARGGVVGLWTARVRSNRSNPVRDAQSYADEILRMVDLLGPQAVGFGTDLEGAGRDAVFFRYADLRAVAEHLARSGMPAAVLQDVCIGNYARVLKKAMAGA